MEGDLSGGGADEWTTVDKKTKKKSRNEVHPAKPTNPSEGWQQQTGRDRKPSRGGHDNNRGPVDRRGGDKNYGKPPPRGGSSSRTGTLPRKYSHAANNQGKPSSRPPSASHSHSVSPSRPQKPASRGPNNHAPVQAVSNPTFLGDQENSNEAKLKSDNVCSEFNAPNQSVEIASCDKLAPMDIQNEGSIPIDRSSVVSDAVVSPTAVDDSNQIKAAEPDHSSPVLHVDDNENITNDSENKAAKKTQDQNVAELQIEENVCNEVTEVTRNVSNDIEVENKAVITNHIQDRNGNCTSPDPNDNFDSLASNEKDETLQADDGSFRQYDRDFLLQLQRNPLSLQKPEKLPDLEIVLNAAMMRPSQSAPVLGEHPTEYVHTLGRMPPVKRDSRRKDPPRKVVSISREPVKLRSAEKAWVPFSKVKPEESELDVLNKKVRSILNKLTPQKFAKLVEQFKELAIDTEEKLIKCTELVFEKAVEEPAFSVAYAKMCRELSLKRVPKADHPGQFVDFGSKIETMCREEYHKESISAERKQKYEDDMKAADTDEDRKRIKEEFDQLESKLRKRSVGNIRFIGELYKLGLLKSSSMHAIIQKLIQQTDEESLESLCNLLTTIGKPLETASRERAVQDPQVGKWFDSYFNRLEGYVADKNNSSRIRFLMQDVIDMRKNNWVGRRKEAGPKTIKQIHEEAKIEALKIQMADQAPMPPTPRRSEDRRRSRMEGPKGQIPPEEWSNVPSKAAKMVEKIDASKLRVSSTPDVNSMKFGPPPSARSFGRGSLAASKKVPESPVVNKNRFELFDESDTEKGPDPDEHAAEDKLSDAVQTSRQVESTSPLKGNSAQDPEELNQKFQSDLNEFLVNHDFKETFSVVCELFHSTNMDVFVESCLQNVLERNVRDQRMIGRLINHVWEKKCLTLDSLVSGFGKVLEFASEFLIDIPKFWECLAAIAVPLLSDHDILADFVQGCLAFLLSEKPLQKDFCTAILKEFQSLYPSQFSSVFSKSKSQLESALEIDLNHFVIENTLCDSATLPNGDSNLPMDELTAKFDRILQSGQDVLRKIDKELDGKPHDKVTLKALTIAVIESALVKGESCNVSLNSNVLKLRTPVLKKYLDADKDRELIAVYAIQSLVHHLQHPNKLLQKILEELYDQEVLSEDAILEWEVKDDPEEKEGRAVALESCKQFLHHLKEAEEEPDECEKVTFEI